MSSSSSVPVIETLIDKLENCIRREWDGPISIAVLDRVKVRRLLRRFRADALTAERRPATANRIECRHCREEIRFIDGSWIDCETYSICADGRKHEPPAAITLAPEQWYEIYDWCRDIQKLAQRISERVDAFANAMPDDPPPQRKE